MNENEWKPFEREGASENHRQKWTETDRSTGKQTNMGRIGQRFKERKDVSRKRRKLDGRYKQKFCWSDRCRKIWTDTRR